MTINLYLCILSNPSSLDMIKFLLIATFFIFPILTFADTSNDWAIDQATEQSITMIGEIIFDLGEDSAPDSLWFDARRSILSFGSLYIAEKIGGEWYEMSEVTLQTSFVSYGGYKLNSETSAVKFYTAVGATLNKYVKNVRINNRWEQEMTWEQELHNIILGDTVLLTAAASPLNKIIYTSSNPEICEIKDSLLIAHTTGRASITASIPSDLFHYPTEDIVTYANVNITSGTYKATTEKAILYPNPCSDGNIYIKGSQISSVKIYTTMGELVHESRHSDDMVELDVRVLTTGVYMVRLVDEGMAQDLRLIVGGN